MKINKSQLDIFLLKRIEENRKELKHNLDSTLQVEQACLEEIVKGIVVNPMKRLGILRLESVFGKTKK